MTSLALPAATSAYSEEVGMSSRMQTTTLSLMYVLAAVSP